MRPFLMILRVRGATAAVDVMSGMHDIDIKEHYIFVFSHKYYIFSTSQTNIELFDHVIKQQNNKLFFIYIIGHLRNFIFITVEIKI